MKTVNMDKPVDVLNKAFTDALTRSTSVGVVSMFLQVWDTPALGFLGVAAAEDTAAYTVVLTDLDPNSKTCHVYFDGRYAYTVYDPNEQFANALAQFNLGSILYRSDYETVSQEVDPDSVQTESPQS